MGCLLMKVSLSGRAGLGRLALSCLVVWSAAASSGHAAEAVWPVGISSVYRLSFNGFEVGSFSFESTSNGRSYAATSKAEVSALFGAFKWKGATTASGNLSAAAPQPASYLLTFKTKSKQGLVRLGFDRGAVKTMSVEPSKPPSPEAVPVKPEQLTSVFDPMSAILAITHAGESGDPCKKTIPIFDGKARFNLVMSYKTRQTLKEKAPSGQPNELYVCKVKYVPIAGHKPKDFVNPWVDYDSIEIALRPVPTAGVFVPYRISIPTTLGAAVMSAEHVEVKTKNQDVIALTQ